MRKSDYRGYVVLAGGEGDSLYNPENISNIRREGTVAEVGTGRELLRYTFEYVYDKLDGPVRKEHEALVPKDRDESFEDEVRRALHERRAEGWTDVLGS